MAASRGLLWGGLGLRGFELNKSKPKRKSTRKLADFRGAVSTLAWVPFLKRRCIADGRTHFPFMPDERDTGTDAGWKFDNSYARLPEALFSRVGPVPVRQPGLILFNERLAVDLGLDVGALNGPEGAGIFAGNLVPPGAEPLAQAYAGHQFGHFTNLGDGRAVLLGEQITPTGARFDIQLKGSGPTPYSRRGDGRAVLGPMVREYIISEAMHALGIPTTRSLAVATTGEPVFREEALPGAVLTRVAASHIRVGTFEYATATGDHAALTALLAHTSHGITRSWGAENPALARSGRRHRVRRRSWPGGCRWGSSTGDEHGQHGAFRRSDRLRALCLHGCLR